MRKRLAQAGLVIAKLGLSNGEFLPDVGNVGAIGTGQTVQSVQNGAGSVMVP